MAPRGSAASSSPTTQQTPPTCQAPATERFPLLRGLHHAWPRSQAPLPPHHRGGPTSTRGWPRRASSRPSWRKSTARCSCFAPPSRGKPPRVANARVNWAGKPATASTPTSTSTTQIRPHERAKSSLPPQRCCGPCPPLQHPRRETCTARRRRSSSKRPSNRPRARRPASASRGTRGTMGARKAPNPRCTRVEQRSTPPTRGARRPRSGSSTRAGKPKMATPVTSSTPDGRATRRRGRRRGGRYDSGEDCSPTPEPPGTRVFSREIRTTTFPQRFR
jgi:hypothetical protein